MNLMKERTPLSAFLIATLTMVMQLCVSVAQSSDLASTAIADTPPQTEEAIHAVAPLTQLTIKTIRRSIFQKNQPHGAPVLPTISLAGSLVAPPPPAPLKPASPIDNPDIRPRHRALAHRVFDLLSVECQQKLKNFYVLYGNPKQRGLAGKGIVIISGEVSDEEFLALLTHEMAGHFWDITCAQGTPSSGRSSFPDGDAPVYNDDPSVDFYSISWNGPTSRKPDARGGDFVTGYATHDAFEDLAESMSYYLLQPEAFAARARSNAILARKYEWLQQHFPMLEQVATGSGWNAKIAWDATKIPYEWIGSKE